MRRVVITGMGTINPIAHSVKEFSQALRDGKSGAATITHIDPRYHTTPYAAEVKKIEQHPYYIGKELRRMDSYSKFGHLASVEAMHDAKLVGADFDPHRIGVLFGVGVGGFETMESIHYTYITREQILQKEDHHAPVSIPPMSVPKLIINIAAANVALYYKLQGPCYTVATACASGTDAIGQSYNLIQANKADIMVTGGVEASITHVGISGFNALHALSTKFSGDPKRASRPFDRDRDGFVMGEGAGVLVIEAEEHARARGATIYGEIRGYAATCDAFHQTAPHPQGRGAVRAMQLALADADLAPTDIDYINAHGTSTPINDPVESAAIREVFTSHADTLKVSSTKSMTGHCVGATGGIEAIASAIAIREGFIPPTINLDNPDEKCDLDYVPNKTESKKIRTAMSNTFGFGGHNGIVIVSQYT